MLKPFKCEDGYYHWFKGSGAAHYLPDAIHDRLAVTCFETEWAAFRALGEILTPEESFKLQIAADLTEVERDMIVDTLQTGTDFLLQDGTYKISPGTSRIVSVCLIAYIQYLRGVCKLERASVSEGYLLFVADRPFCTLAPFIKFWDKGERGQVFQSVIEWLK